MRFTAAPSPTIGRWLLIQLTLRETCVTAHTPWEIAGVVVTSRCDVRARTGRARRARCDQDHANRREQDPDHRHDRNEPLPPSTADIGGDPGAGNQRTAAKYVNQVHRPLPKLCPRHQNRSVPLPMRTYKYPLRRKRLTRARCPRVAARTCADLEIESRRVALPARRVVPPHYCSGSRMLVFFGQLEPGSQACRIRQCVSR